MQTKKTTLREDEQNLLDILCSAFGPSGHESDVRSIIVSKLKEAGAEVKIDVSGNICGLLKATEGVVNPLKVMLCAHIDEVGFMVREVLRNGTCRVLPIGAINERFLTNHRVELRNNRGQFYGTFVMNARLPEDRARLVLAGTALADLVVDFGFDSQESALASIAIGDVMAFAPAFSVIMGDKFMSKAIDDRAGAYILLDVLQDMSSHNRIHDLYFAFSVQEELGTRGAKTLAHAIRPDVAVVTDVSHDLTHEGRASQVGGGVLLRHKDASYIQRPEMTQWLKRIYAMDKIKWQDYISMGGTDAGVISLSHDGVPVIQTCLVAKEIHTGNSIASFKDLQAVKEAIIAILRHLDKNAVKEITGGIQ